MPINLKLGTLNVKHPVLNQYVSIDALNLELNLADYNVIQKIVKAGLASHYFKIGDQIHTKWRPDSTSDTEYDLVWNIVHFGDVTNAQDETVPGMYLQTDFVLPYNNVPTFNYQEALYIVPQQVYLMNQSGAIINSNDPYNSLPPAEYFIYDSRFNVNVYFQTTSAYLPGTKFVLEPNSSYRNSSTPSNSQIGRIVIYDTEDNNLTWLPIYKRNATFKLGNIPDTAIYPAPFKTEGFNYLNYYENGRPYWKWSVIRQYLNSSETEGEWYSNMEIPYYIKPSSLPDGFMAGLPEGFLNIVKPIQISTYNEMNQYETTYDKFFLPSPTQEGLTGNPVEGYPWTYWEEKEDHIHYTIDGTKSPTTYRTRNNSLMVNIVSSTQTGVLTSATPISATTKLITPACCIC